jgi:hypothetical protein
MSSKSTGAMSLFTKSVRDEERRDMWKSLHLFWLWLILNFFLTSTPPGPQIWSYMNFYGKIGAGYALQQHFLFLY